MPTSHNAVKCKLSQGAFSDEIVFEVELAGGGEYAGGCSRTYCYQANGSPLGSKQLSATATGRVLAAVLESEGESQFRVQVPDGEVLLVKEDQLTTVKEVSPHVPSRP